MFALRYLTGAELLTATHIWVDPADAARAALDRIDTTRPLLIPLIAARSAVQAAIAAREPDDPTNEGRALDARHDALGRGVYDALTVAAGLAPTEARAAELLGVRAALFPTGRLILRATWAEEAGQVDARADRLTAAHRAVLAGITVEGRTLASYLEELQTVGHALGGAVVTQAAEDAAARGPSMRGKLFTATSRLARVIRNLGEALELGGADDATYELFFGPLRIAAEAAQRRAVARSGASVPTPTAPGADPGATPPSES